jgi:Xaa-Pro dipeptidase
MAVSGLDALVVSSAENLFYLTGFASLAWGRTALILPRTGDAVWIMRLTELSNIRALRDVLWAKAAIGVPDTVSFADVLAKAVADVVGGAARVGVEAGNIPASLQAFAALRAGDGHMANANGLVEELRRVKSPAEIALMRRAGGILHQAITDAFAALHENMLDSDLACVVTHSLIRGGSDRVAQMPNVASGPRTARAHITWGHLPIRRGELITVEPAACVENYHVPIYKIMSIGSPGAEAVRMFEVCKVAFQEGWATIRPGMTSNDAAAIYETAIRRAGYGDRMVTRPAYSIGIAFPPGWGEDNVMSIRAGDENVLEAGMCFHICPCLYQDGIGCVAASMPAVLMESGFASLSGTGVELLIK